ncbi:MAG: molybdenum cofactor guanylyltransferase [candidate division FCPU426 bacterium]
MALQKTMAAAILTGGLSLRMGRDKSLLRYQGQTLAALAATKALKAGCWPLFVVGPKKPYGLPPGVLLLAEKWRGSGPLSGIEAALSEAGGPCLVLPCDMPFLSVAFLRRLVLAHGPRIRVTACAGELRPLPAVYDASLLPVIRRKLKAEKNALFPLLKSGRQRRVPCPKAFFLENLNSPKSMDRLRKL